MVAGMAGLTGCIRSDLRKAERCLALGDADRARGLFSSVLDQSPDDRRARRGLGLTMLALARQKSDDGDDRPANWGAAVREMERADTTSDSALRENLLDGRVRWARSLATHGDTLRAEEILEVLVVAAPNRTGPRRSLAILLARMGSGERAEELFLQNSVLDSTDVDTWFNLGLLAWSGGRRQEAAIHFLRAQKLAPSDPEIQWWASKATNETAK